MTTESNSAANPFEHLYGPVPSRRLGRSLGIDLVKPKTCTESCVFCQIGRTNRLTLDRREYVPVSEVVEEFHAWLARDGKADVVTLAGAGEPTLHSRFGEVLDAVRAGCDSRTVLLSNGTLFWMKDVRRAACRADVVKVSVSAWDQESFQRINRPHPELRFDCVQDGIRAFRRAYDGELWVEVMVLEGLNDSLDAMHRLREQLERIEPDHIHLNTSVRPPAERWACCVEHSRLERLARVFGPRASVIAEPAPGAGEKQTTARPAAVGVLQVLARRGCTIDDLVNGLQLPRDAVEREVARLCREGAVQPEERGAQTYYIRVFQE